MGSIGAILGFYRDNGKENGNYYSIRGSYPKRDQLWRRKKEYVVPDHAGTLNPAHWAVDDLRRLPGVYIHIYV